MVWGKSRRPHRNGGAASLMRQQMSSLLALICASTLAAVSAAILCFLLLSPWKAANSKAIESFSFRPRSSSDNLILETLAEGSLKSFPDESAIFLTTVSFDSTVYMPLYNVARLACRKQISFEEGAEVIGGFRSFVTPLALTSKTSKKYNESGDGIAFFYTTFSTISLNFTGNFFGLKAESLKDRRERFMALEFDSFQNLERSIQDVSASHIAININNISSTNVTDTENPHDPLHFYNNLYIIASLSYDSSANSIEVWATNESHMQRLSNPILSVNVNFSQIFDNDVGLYVAITASSRNNSQSRFLDRASHTAIDHISSINVTDTENPQDPLHFYNNLYITASLSYDSSANSIQAWAINESHRQRLSIPILSVNVNLSQVFKNDIGLHVNITALSRNNSRSRFLDPLTKRDSGAHSSKRYLPLISLTSILILVFVIVLFIQYSHMKKLRAKRKAIEAASTCFHSYKYADLKRATQNFSDKQILGKGMSGIVYKGVLPDRTTIAIKRMRDGLVEPDAIVKEVRIISKIKHRNLLELQGWCIDKGERLLVYKYMPNGSLDRHLYGDKRRSGEVLDSRTRFRIIMDVAAGLQYLHNELDDCVLHRDVKPANVLLTESMEAKLGDFGLARLLAHDEEVVTLARGTAGYIAPEAYRQNKVTDKTDVYSFGVLMLETACGKRAYDNSDSDNEHIADRVRTYHQTTDIMDALDPNIRETVVTPDQAQVPANHLEGNEVAEQPMAGETMELQRWRRVLQLGLACCEDDPQDRPSMTDISTILRALEDCVVTPPAKAGKYDPGS